MYGCCCRLDVPVANCHSSHTHYGWAFEEFTMRNANVIIAMHDDVEDTVGGRWRCVIVWSSWMLWRPLDLLDIDAICSSSMNAHIRAHQIILHRIGSNVPCVELNKYIIIIMIKYNLLLHSSIRCVCHRSTAHKCTFRFHFQWHFIWRRTKSINNNKTESTRCEIFTAIGFDADIIYCARCSVHTAHTRERLNSLHLANSYWHKRWAYSVVV